MRCDLHVHSLESGMFNAPLLNRVCRESYKQSLALYERLKRRGMSIVTITDHDSIDGAKSSANIPASSLVRKSPYGCQRNEITWASYNISERDHTNCSAAATISRTSGLSR